VGKLIFPEDKKVYMTDTIYCLNNPRDIKKCYAYLTSSRLIAVEKPSSLFKSINSIFSDSNRISFEIPLGGLSSMRQGRLGLRNLLILKTIDKAEFQIQFTMPEEDWKQAIIDAVIKGQPGTNVKTIGDYIKFKRQ